MTKPFDVEEIAADQQTISECKRFGKMVGSLAKLEERLAQTVSLKIAANEAQARLDGIRGSEETLKAELDLKKEEIRKAQETLTEVMNAKQAEVTRLDNEITEKRAELDRLIKSRTEWLASVGLKA
jgi:hypothetical protein